MTTRLKQSLIEQHIFDLCLVVSVVIQSLTYLNDSGDFNKGRGDGGTLIHLFINTSGSAN